jgi:hypothetical protein
MLPFVPQQVVLAHEVRLQCSFHSSAPVWELITNTLGMRMVRYTWRSEWDHRGTYPRGPNVSTGRETHIIRVFTRNRIGWPFAIDQPLNVAYMARTLDLGYEFTKMRANHCPVKKKSSDHISTDMRAWEIEVQAVLDSAYTAVGQRKRENAVRIGENLALAWSEHSGRARLQLSEFLDAMNI